jgi:hypothetical protein
LHAHAHWSGFVLGARARGIGDYWAVQDFGVIAFQAETDDDVWQLANWTCTGAGC